MVQKVPTRTQGQKKIKSFYKAKTAPKKDEEVRKVHVICLSFHQDLVFADEFAKSSGDSFQLWLFLFCGMYQPHNIRRSLPNLPPYVDNLAPPRKLLA